VPPRPASGAVRAASRAQRHQPSETTRRPVQQSARSPLQWRHWPSGYGCGAEVERPCARVC
jgi:hypothetical protein